MIIHTFHPRTSIHFNSLHFISLHCTAVHCTSFPIFHFPARLEVSLSWKSNKHYIFWVCACILALVVCHANLMCPIFVCGLSGSTIFFHFVSQSHDFWKKVPEYKTHVLIFPTNCVWNICHSKKKNSTKYYKKFAYVFM